jgi:hypothetical protein
MILIASPSVITAANRASNSPFISTEVCRQRIGVPLVPVSCFCDTQPTNLVFLTYLGTMGSNTVGVLCAEVTRVTNSGNDSNSSLKHFHSRINKGLRNLCSAERNINSHMRFGMRCPRNSRYVNETRVQKRSIEMIGSSVRSGSSVAGGMLSHKPADKFFSNHRTLRVMPRRSLFLPAFGESEPQQRG